MEMEGPKSSDVFAEPDRGEADGGLAELLNLLAMALGFSGFMYRNQKVAWIGFFAALYAFVNGRSGEYKSIFQLFMNAGFLFILYFTPAKADS